MPAKKTTKTPNKSDFIRQQPASLSGPEVVAKGKAAGIKFSPQLVYNVRGGSKAIQGTVEKTRTSKPTAAVAPKAAPAKSKAEFIRSLPKTMPVKEVVATGKAQGVKFDETYVYWARGSKKKAANKPPTRATTPRTGAAVPGPITTGSKAEMLLRAVAAEIGLGRAMEILSGERAMVKMVIGG